MKRRREVLLAKSAGFCPGVRKAIDRVLELARSGKGPVYTLGPLVHNGQVLARLEARGVHAVESLAQLKGRRGTAVIRAHGVAPELEARLRGLGLEVVDATCPMVKKVHRAIAKYAREGYATVIVGDKGHAEVRGLLGCAGGKAFVVAGPQEARRLPRLDKAHVAAQTTQESGVFAESVAAVKRRAAVVAVSDTICPPSRERQRETARLAGRADLVIVVGDRRSANTARLAALCRGLCPDTVLVETEAELDGARVRAARRIAVTAGASTPGEAARRVRARARELSRR